MIGFVCIHVIRHNEGLLHVIGQMKRFLHDIYQI